MGSVLIQLLPPAIGNLAMPTWILLVVVLVRSSDGLVQATAFVGGVTAVRLLQGVIFATILTASDVTIGMTSPGTVVSVLLLVTGILMWAAALKKVFQVDDSRNRLFTWSSKIKSLTPVSVFGLGALLAVTSSRAWLFTLAAISIIGEAALNPPQDLIAFLFYVLAAQLLIVAPIVASVWSSARFDAASRWLEGHSRPLVIVVSLVVGGYFLWHGITGLLT